MKILVRVISVAAVTISLAHAKSLATAAASQINYLGSGTFYSSRDDSQDYFSLTGQVDCSAHTFKPEPNVLDHIGKLKEITRSYCASTQSLVATRFAAADCAKASTCRHSVGNNNTNLIDADNILNEIIAKDYIKNSLIMYGEDMERLEGLTKFAQKQYDTKLGSQCLARFQRKSISRCDSGFAEQTFTEHQKNCSSGYGCFKSDENNSGVVSFEKFKSSHKDSEGKYMYDYYKYRVETKFNNEISGDDKKLSELGDLVSSAKFKALSLDAKIVRFTSEMGMENDGRLKDPVLGYDLGTGSKEPKRFIASAKFKEVIKLLQDKNVTSTSFAKDFDGLRKKRVQALLSSDDICGSTPTFVKICSEATSILKGGSVKKDANFVDHIASPVTMDDDYLDRIKKILGSDLNSDFFETLVNARRCISFGLTDTQGNPIVTTSKATSGTAGDSGGGSSDRNDMESKGVNPPQQVTPVVQNEPSNMRALYDEAAAKNGGGVEPKSEVAEKIVYDPASIESKFEPISTTAPSTATAIANNFNDMFSTSGFDTFAGKDKPKAEEVAAKPESVSDAPAAKGSSNDKMNEYLMKKLAAAEENLEKLKADNEAAEEDRVKQKKIDEETALIKDLKGQISDLKTQTAKNSAKKAADESVAAQEKAQIASRSNNFAGATIIGSRSPEASQVAVATESYDEGRSRASAIQAANARSIASSSGPVLNSVTNSDGSKTTTLGSGLVVTTVDGMTAEKAAITISNRIFELNGTPFYIEEGGVVKEIIAVVKDGKVLLDEKGNPIFEKIVKGKVGDKKFAKNKDKDRAPASITDAADLKRDQEEKLKRERAEYLKLKNLTNEALKRK